MLRYRNRLVILAILLIGSMMVPFGVLAHPRGPDAHAEAVVQASRLDMSLSALPGYGKAVFENGSVAQSVAGLIGVAPDEVVPTYASLKTEPNSIQLRVVGHADDQQTATQIANVAARAYVQGLNEPGVGVGAFTIQALARPTYGTTGVTTTDAVIVALTVGLALGLSLAGLLLLPGRERAEV